MNVEKHKMRKKIDCSLTVYYFQSHDFTSKWQEKETFVAVGIDVQIPIFQFFLDVILE